MKSIEEAIKDLNLNITKMSDINADLIRSTGIESNKTTLESIMEMTKVVGSVAATANSTATEFLKNSLKNNVFVLDYEVPTIIPSMSNSKLMKNDVG